MSEGEEVRGPIQSHQFPVDVGASRGEEEEATVEGNFLQLRGITKDTGSFFKDTGEQHKVIPSEKPLDSSFSKDQYIQKETEQEEEKTLIGLAGQEQFLSKTLRQDLVIHFQLILYLYSAFGI